MKLNNKHLEIFRKECFRLHKKWGLTDWELHVDWSAQSCDQTYAECSANLTARTALITLWREWPDDKLEANQITEKNLKQTAKHEMIHVLLAPLAEVAASRYVSEDEYNAGNHAVVMRLMKLIE